MYGRVVIYTYDEDKDELETKARAAEFVKVIGASRS